jgi:hypothetical protein
MGVVIEICIKYPGGPTRMRGTDMGVKLGQKGTDARCGYTWRSVGLIFFLNILLPPQIQYVDPQHKVDKLRLRDKNVVQYTYMARSSANHKPLVATVTSGFSFQ